MTHHHLTIFHNGAVLPVGESVEMDSDPSVFLGSPDIEAGSIKMYNCGQLRIIVSRGKLTTSSIQE
jgi:hypothetical protein